MMKSTHDVELRQVYAISGRSNTWVAVRRHHTRGTVTLRVNGGREECTVTALYLTPVVNPVIYANMAFDSHGFRYGYRGPEAYTNDMQRAMRVNAGERLQVIPERGGPSWVDAVSDGWERNGNGLRFWAYLTDGTRVSVDESRVRALPID